MEEKYYKLDVMETRAIKIKANGNQLVYDEGTMGYALAWLNITNNQREHKREILKVYNDYHNGIYLIVEPSEENVKAAEDYLQRLGFEIECKEECIIVQPDEVFNDDDLDVELINWF